MARKAQQHLLAARSCAGRSSGSFPKLDPRLQFKNPVMFIVEIGSVITTGIFVLELVRGETRLTLVRRRDLVLALADRAVRELRRGGSRGSRQGAGKRTPRDAHDHDRAAPARQRDARGRARRRPSARRHRRRGSRRGHPGRRRDHRGCRLGRRVRDHGRVGPGDPRGRRRPLRRHRRHEAPLRPPRDSGHAGAGALVPRSDDRARRRCRAPQDAERDRPEHPARRAHDHVPRRGRDAEAVRRVRRDAALGDRPDRAPRSR